MIIRSLNELDDALSESLAWRKQEITTLVLQAQASKAHQRVALCRSALLVLYAHWEGFVKEAADAYLAYVSRQGRAYRRLKPGIVALLLRSRICSDAQASSIRPLVHLVDFFYHNLGNKPDWPKSGMIITESNLMVRVLEDIFWAVGLVVPKELLAKGLLLETRLVLTRHKIAHGQRVSVDVDELGDLRDHLIEALEAIKTELENAASTAAFELAAAPA